MSDWIRQYGRQDVNYDTWYSQWMKDLARNNSRAEIEKLLGRKTKEVAAAASAHLRAIDATTSMTSQSARRAHARNAVAAAGEYRAALNGALEIYDLFPEYTKEAA